MSEPDLPREPADAIALGREIGSYASRFAAEHDRDATFVTEGFDVIRELGYGAIAVPRELGGAGHSLDTVCRAQAAMAEGCANTSLAIAMHQHNVLSLTYRWTEGETHLEPILKRIADGLLLCSSGAMDPRRPGVTAVPTPDGLLVTGRKGLASGGPGCDLLGTPVAVVDGNERYLGAAYIPLDAPGVTIRDNWDAMGMRGSGSNAVDFVDVLVPDDNIISGRPWLTPPHGRRPRISPAVEIDTAADPAQDARASDPHRNPGLLIAVTVIASVYLGIADGVWAQALVDVQRGKHPDDPITHRLAGLMTQHRHVAWWAMEGLLDRSTSDSIDTEDHFRLTMLAKRQVVLSSIATVETAIEMLGSMSYMRQAPYEQALRDIRAGVTHPLAPEATLAEVGRSLLADGAADNASP